MIPRQDPDSPEPAPVHDFVPNEGVVSVKTLTHIRGNGVVLTLPIQNLARKKGSPDTSVGHAVVVLPGSGGHRPP